MKKRRPSPAVRILGGFVWLVLCLGALGAGTFFGFTGQSGLAAEVVKQTLARVEPREVFDQRDYVNILILGIDENRYYKPRDSKEAGQVLEGGRSDVMMVAHLDFDTKKISGLSISRDIAIALDGGNRHKINAYYERGGPDMARRAAESVIGLPIQKVIDFKYSDFREIVDAIGGVEVDVEKRMLYHDYRGDLHVDLTPGRHHLDGKEAEGFVRYRKADAKAARELGLRPDTDEERQKRQRALMLEIKKKIESNPRTLPSFANAMMATLGKNLTEREFAAIILFGRNVGSDNVKMDTVPYIDLGIQPGIGWIMDVDRDKLPAKLEELGFTESSSATASNR
ncbi:MAG: LCP family protein [Chthonomonas sp.]|nr:LCP family protein [Chthonomonas sp.]